jgi:hypothetical protein
MKEREESVGRRRMPPMIDKQTVYSAAEGPFTLIGWIAIALSLLSQRGLVSQKE